MNRLSLRFVLTNLITSILLIVNSGELRRDHDAIFEEKNLSYGITLYAIILIGTFFARIKARDLANRRVHALNIPEVILMVALYLLALAGNALILYTATILIFGAEQLMPSWMETGNLLVQYLVLGLLISEGIVLTRKQPKAISPRLVRWSNYVLPIYSGAAVGLLWNTLMLGRQFSFEFTEAGTFFRLLTLALLAILVILPFQRLLWFEAFAESQGWKENLKVILGLLVVIVCAILPAFF